MRPWAELQQELRKLVAENGVAETAAALPASRVTVYRLLKGETRRPSKPLQACIERMVKEKQPDGC